MPTLDIIDELAGLSPGHPLSELRLHRAQAKAQAQASYEALFNPLSDEAFSRQERFALALFVAELHAAPAAARFYGERLAAATPIGDLPDAVRRAAVSLRQEGPYGRFPQGPLSRWDDERPGRAFPADALAVIGRRLSAAFAHAELLVLHPRDAARPALAALSEAGWSDPAIVTLSQLVAFLSFQIRTAAGLAVLARAATDAHLSTEKEFA